MRYCLAIICWIAISFSYSNSVFKAVSGESSRLTVAEADRFERMKRLPRVVRTKLIVVNDEVLHQSKSSHLSFIGENTRSFSVTQNAEGVWVGHEVKGSDHFLIRNSNGYFVGHALMRGKQ